MKYVPLAIVGPSGIGKGTLINHLLQKYPKIVEKSVSYTTRPPRPAEKDGVDYNFVTVKTLRKVVIR